MNNTHIKARNINTEKMSTALTQKIEVIKILTHQKYFLCMLFVLTHRKQRYFWGAQEPEHATCFSAGFLTRNNSKMNMPSSFYIIDNSKCIFINIKLPLIKLIKSIQELNFTGRVYE